ncbi:MAG: hypothetical protein V3V08_17070 [Nannocystaceae bacterium]
MAERLFHVPFLTDPDNPSVCTLQVSAAPLSSVGVPDPNGEPMSDTMTDVHIELWEADRLLPDGGKQDDLLATFVVELGLDGRGGTTVQETDLIVPSLRQGHIELGILEVRLELGGGNLGPIHRIPVHGADTEWPHTRPGWAKKRATTELALTIASDYTDETTRTSLNLLEKGFLPSGPVAAWICLENTPGQANARQLTRTYWNEHADLVVMEGEGGFDASLEGIAEVLASSGRTFQEVNIIAHGTEDGVSLFARVLDPDDPDAGGWISHDAIRVEGLGVLGASGSLPARHSRLVVRGCTIGRDHRLLKALRTGFGGVRVFAASDRVLYIFQPAGGTPEYCLLQRYFSPVPGHVRNPFRGSAQKTAAVLSADPIHGTGTDFPVWARHREAHWSQGGVIPRFFRTARELEWEFAVGGVASREAGRAEFEAAVWTEIQAGNAGDGLDERYRLATHEPVVDPQTIDFSPSFADWTKRHKWKIHERFANKIYFLTLRRTHVVVEVLLTDPPDDPEHGTPVPLDLATHMVSEP